MGTEITLIHEQIIEKILAKQDDLFRERFDQKQADE
jgi:hypothetical protein